MDDEEHRARRIMALLDLGRYADAAAAARTELGRHPESATLHQLLAQSLIGQDDIPAALQHARAAVALEPDSPEALQLLAGTLAEVGEGPQSRDVALRAVRLAPDDWRSHHAYARTLLFGVGGPGALAEAEAAARRSVQLAPHEPQTHVILGIVRWRLDDYSSAEDAFRHALALDPGHADAMGNLAQITIDRGDLEEGAMTLSRALSLSPQSRELHAGLAGAASAILFHTALLAAVMALALRGVHAWAPASVLTPAASGLFVAVAVPFVAALKNLPPGSWRLMFPSRAARAQWSIQLIGWSVLASCPFVAFGSTTVALAAVAVVVALVVLVLLGQQLGAARSGPVAEAGRDPEEPP